MCTNVLSSFRFPYPINQTIKVETVVLANNPVGIAFDSINRHLFWTEDHAGKIMRCNTNGSNKTTIHTEIAPSALTIDIDNRFVSISS